MWILNPLNNTFIVIIVKNITIIIIMNIVSFINNVDCFIQSQMSLLSSCYKGLFSRSINFDVTLSIQNEELLNRCASLSSICI